MINIGIDIGAISVKVSAIGEDENDKLILSKIASENDNFFHTGEGNNSQFLKNKYILVSKYKRIKGMPMHSTYEILNELMNYIPEDKIGYVAVTGGGGKLFNQILGIPYIN
ncbi:MAG: hypothetical protein ACPL7B_09295, partial [Candidatus Poribacteria bacterium]